MARIPDAASMTGREIFLYVAKNFWRDVFWYAGLAGVIAILGRFVWWWAGVVLFALFVLLVIASSLHSLVLSLMGAFVTTYTIYRRLRGQSSDLMEQFYMGGAQLLDVLSTAILAGYCFWLYTLFFH